MLAARDAEPVVRAVTAAADRRGVAVAIGVSDVLRRPRDRPPAGGGLRPAGARRAATACVHAERLGPLRFLLDAPDVSQVRAVVAEQLGPLLDYDDGRSDLLATLRAFVAADGNVAETAKACFIHKNTLRYRLKRLTEVLGRDPAEPDVKFHLRMAFDLSSCSPGMGIDLLPAPAETAPTQGTTSRSHSILERNSRPALAGRLRPLTHRLQ